MPLLELRDVTRRFGAFEAVKRVSFAVEGVSSSPCWGRPAVARPPYSG
ncbi:MAG: hypothetical protein PHS77_00735 [Gallionellaceae bacterium]|nr:hypothetical protein [Gallionellaceae bacterium]